MNATRLRMVLATAALLAIGIGLGAKSSSPSTAPTSGHPKSSGVVVTTTTLPLCRGVISHFGAATSTGMTFTFSDGTGACRPAVRPSITTKKLPIPKRGFTTRVSSSSSFFSSAQGIWLLIVAALLVSIGVVFAVRRHRRGRSRVGSQGLKAALLLGAAGVCLFVAACLFLTSLGGVPRPVLSPLVYTGLPCSAAINWGNGRVVSANHVTISGHTVTFLGPASCRLPTSNGVRWTLVDDTAVRDVNPHGVPIDTFVISRGCSDNVPYAGANLAMTRSYRVQFTSDHPQGTCVVALIPPPTGPPTRLSTRVLALGFTLFGAVLGAIYLTVRRRRRVPDAEELDAELGEAADVAEEETVEQSLVGALRSLKDIPDPRRAVVRCWVELEGALGSLGVRRGRGETPKELAQRVLETLDVDGSGLDQLQLWYRDARYSLRQITPEIRDRAIELIENLLEQLDTELARRASPPIGVG